jgi:hypothetical protein
MGQRKPNIDGMLLKAAYYALCIRHCHLLHCFDGALHLAELQEVLVEVF